MGSLLQCVLQCAMKPSSSGSAKPITAHVHLLAVSPPSIEQQTTAFSSRAASPPPTGQFSHTCTFACHYAHRPASCSTSLWRGLGRRPARAHQVSGFWGLWVFYTCPGTGLQVAVRAGERQRSELIQLATASLESESAMWLATPPSFRSPN